MAQRKYPTEEELRRQHVRFLRIASHIKDFLTHFVKWTAICVIVYTGVYLPVKESAGKQTLIDVAMKWVVDADVQVYVSWAVAAGCAGWALTERRMRIKERDRRDPRTAELERYIDPARTSSDMTVEGEERQRADPNQTHDLSTTEQQDDARQRGDR